MKVSEIVFLAMFLVFGITARRTVARALRMIGKMLREPYKQPNYLAKYPTPLSRSPLWSEVQSETTVPAPLLKPWYVAVRSYTG